LEAQNKTDELVGYKTGGFPVKGQHVKIFWNSFGSWHKGIVKRWSKKENKWVIKYDDWHDNVYEDVSVLEWKFPDTEYY